MSASLTTQGAISLRSGEDVGMRWWSQRFIELLESFGLGSRLERGLQYARDGHVVDLEVEPGIVLAKVQGSRYTPYRVRIRPRVFSEHQWRRADKAIAARSGTLAQLLAGELPHELEQVLAESKLALLPASYEELRVSCSCPDQANPCKHAAAVYYVLAERFDEDPFALLTLRGRTRDELLDALRVRRAQASGAGLSRVRRARAAGVAQAAGGPDQVGDAGQPAPPLASALDDFWCCGDQLSQLDVTPLAAESPAALIVQLGQLPQVSAPAERHSVASTGEATEAQALKLLARAYTAMATAAERRALGA